MVCSPPGSFVHGILQARILDWVAIPFSRGSSRPRDGTWSPSLQADSLASEPPGESLAMSLAVMLLKTLAFVSFPYTDGVICMCLVESRAETNTPWQGT